MRCIVLIAASGADAGRWVKTHMPVFDGRVVVVTAHSPNAARGVTAFAVLATPSGRRLPNFDELLADARLAVTAQVLR
jgi:hypothetical protein